MGEKIKVEVLKRFRNKFSKAVVHPGEVIEVSENRLVQINSAGYGELVRRIEVKDSGEDGANGGVPGQEDDSGGQAPAQDGETDKSDGEGD